MAISLEKNGRSYTPIHLIDEESTMPKPPALPKSPVPPIPPKEQLMSTVHIQDKPLGVLEKKQLIADNISNARAKIKQARVFTVKRAIRLKYQSEPLEAGHKVILRGTTCDCGIWEYNISCMRLQAKTLLMNGEFDIDIELKDFDKFFEPDYTLSRLYSSNPIVRLFKRKEINAYLQSARNEILHKDDKGATGIV